MIKERKINMKKMLKMAALMAACLLAIPAVQAQTTEQDADLLYATSMLKPGTVAPDFTLPTLAGKNFSLSQLKAWCLWASRLTSTARRGKMP